MLRLSFLFVALFALLQPASAEPTARLIHFTDDGTATGTPLLPDFQLHSLWNALGVASNGTAYFAVSNHDGENGNVAIFALDRGAEAMRVVGDIKTASLAAGNWGVGETQYKVHTFLNQHPSGLIYFATMPSDTPREERGAQLYTLDPDTDEITNISQDFPYTLDLDGKLVPNTGVIAQGQGIKGMSFSPARPDELVFMLHDTGRLVIFDLKTGDMETVGMSSRVSYIFHVDDEGDIYYIGDAPGAPQSLVWFDRQTGKTAPLITGLHKDEEIGMALPWADAGAIQILLARSKRQLIVDTRGERILRGGQDPVCGRNYWRLYNMALSEDGAYVYFVSNNNADSRLLRAPAAGGLCRDVLDVDDLLGPRNLAFGGQNVWVDGSFFTPVWNHETNDDLAILKVTVE